MKKTLTNIVSTAVAGAALLFGCGGPEYIAAPPMLSTHTRQTTPPPSNPTPPPVEAPKPVPTEIAIEYTINSPKAFESVCKTLEKKENKKLNEFGKILLARLWDKEGDGVLSAEEVFAAYKSETKTLSHSEPVLAGKGEEGFMKETAEQHLQGKGLKEKIAFVQELRNKTQQGSYVEATKVEIRYQIENAPAFDALCEAAAIPQGRQLDDFDKIVLASQIDSDNDGKVSLQDIANAYMKAAREQPGKIRYSIVVETPQAGMTSLVEKRLKGLTLDQKIELVKEFLKSTLPSRDYANPPAPYTIEKEAETLFNAICVKENRKDKKAKDELAAALDKDADWKVTAAECIAYSKEKGYDSAAHK